MMNTMTKLVFNQDHLQDLKSGIGEVLDVFMEILETPTKSIKDVKNRLQKIVSCLRVYPMSESHLITLSSFTPKKKEFAPDL